MDAHWYALHSKPREETALWQEVKARGFETFYPQLRVRRVNPRARRVQPYFPCYLFVRADLDAAAFSTFHWMPHALGLVCFGGEPAWVPDDFIRVLREHMVQLAEAGAELFAGLRPGDRLKIHDGPLAGYSALFDCGLAGRDRVRVLLESLNGRRLPVELDVSCIQRHSCA